MSVFCLIPDLYLELPSFYANISLFVFQCADNAHYVVGFSYTVTCSYPIVARMLCVDEWVVRGHAVDEKVCESVRGKYKF